MATLTFAHGKSLHLDARVVGVGVGAIAIWLGASFPVVVLLAAAAALLRLAGLLACGVLPGA